jgi:hypothetical protein
MMSTHARSSSLRLALATAVMRNTLGRIRLKLRKKERPQERCGLSGNSTQGLWGAKRGSPRRVCAVEHPNLVSVPPKPKRSPRKLVVEFVDSGHRAIETLPHAAYFSGQEPQPQGTRLSSLVPKKAGRMCDGGYRKGPSRTREKGDTSWVYFFFSKPVSPAVFATVLVWGASCIRSWPR